MAANPGTTGPDITYRDVVELSDPLLPDVLDLWQATFPARQQVRVSHFFTLFDATDDDLPADRHLVVATGNEGEVLAFAYYEVEPVSEPLGYLWYLAVDHEHRSQGIGATFYRYLRKRMRASGARFIVMEVEKPDLAADFSDEEEEQARRRLAFCGRLGLHELRGVRYLLTVGWQPPYEMSILVDDLDAKTLGANADATCIFDLASELWGESIVLTEDESVRLAPCPRSTSS
jgi:GNAT superfamily N-acetyltransferase